MFTFVRSRSLRTNGILRLTFQLRELRLSNWDSNLHLSSSALTHKILSCDRKLSFQTREAHPRQRRCTQHRSFCLYKDSYCLPVFTQVRYMAGHAKWQNIKHVKAEKDRIKALLCNKYGNLARSAVREGGPDPKLNSRLADVIEEARKHNVPMSTIEGAMKRGSVNSSKIKFGTIEVLGPGGCLILIEYETDNISETRHDIKLILKKYNLAILQGEGKWRAAFEQKGILKVTGMTTGQPLDMDKGLDAAIEAGAEDVQQKTDDEEQDYLEFHCDPADLHKVKKGLEQMSYKVEEAYVGFLPTVTVELASEDHDAVGNLLSELEEMRDVVRIYENVH